MLQRPALCREVRSGGRPPADGAGTHAQDPFPRSLPRRPRLGTLVPAAPAPAHGTLPLARCRAATGEVVWKRRVSDYVEAMPDGTMSRSSPALDLASGLLIVGTQFRGLLSLTPVRVPAGWSWCCGPAVMCVICHAAAAWHPRTAPGTLDFFGALGDARPSTSPPHAGSVVRP